MPAPVEHILLSYVPVWILKLIWPLKEEIRTRDREMKVLCLGLGRTGTDSLRNALIDLGYEDVAHGWYFVSEENMPTLIQMERLKRLQISNPSLVTTHEFDTVLGHCMAIADAPAASFASELLQAYPNAKVILNRRTDIDAWHRSQSATIDKLNTDWPSWTRQWFDSETFWIGRLVYWNRKQTNFDFARNGREWYVRHYERLEEELRGRGREWLDWRVEDGWGSLCGFLGEDVPMREFPNENNSGAFDKRRVQVHGARTARADRRMRMAAGVVVAAVAAGVGWYFLR